jgi:hypothetical protein
MKTQEEIIQIIDDEINDLKQSLMIEKDWIGVTPDINFTRRLIDNLTCTLDRIERIKSRILVPIMTTKEAVTKLDNLLEGCERNIEKINKVIMFENGSTITITEE